jgi:transposase-like protein
MANGYSTDLRSRAVALIEGGESRREVARLLDLAASTTIRWMDRWQTTGSVAAKPGTGHCRSPLGTLLRGRAALPRGRSQGVRCFEQEQTARDARLTTINNVEEANVEEIEPYCDCCRC